MVILSLETAYKMALELNVQTRLKHARIGEGFMSENETHLGHRRLDRTAISMWVYSIYQELRSRACPVDPAEREYSSILRPHEKRAHCYDKRLLSSAHRSFCWEWNRILTCLVRNENFKLKKMKLGKPQRAFDLHLSRFLRSIIFQFLWIVEWKMFWDSLAR